MNKTKLILIAFILFYSNLAISQVNITGMDIEDRKVIVHYTINSNSNNYFIGIHFMFKPEGEQRAEKLNINTANLTGSIGTVPCTGGNRCTKSITWHINDPRILIGELKPVITYRVRKLNIKTTIPNDKNQYRQKSTTDVVNLSSWGTQLGVGLSRFKSTRDNYSFGGYSANASLFFKFSKYDKTLFNIEPGVRSYMHETVNDDNIRLLRNFTYVELPIELSLGGWFGKNNRGVSKSVYLSGGVFGGYMIDAREYMKDLNTDDSPQVENITSKGSYNLNKFQFGPTASISLTFIEFDFRYNVLPLWSNELPSEQIFTDEFRDISPNNPFTVNVSFMFEGKAKN